jgi:hypothetical protein
MVGGQRVLRSHGHAVAQGGQRGSPAPGRCLPPEGILDFLGGLLDFALHLVSFALSAETLVACGLAGRFLDLAFGALCRVLGFIDCSHGVSSSAVSWM